MISGFVSAQSLDYRILRKINNDRIKSLDPAMQALSASSDYVAIGTPLILLGKGFISNNASLKKEGLNAAVSTFGTYALGYILKKSINKERPYVTYPNIQNYKIENSASFPSGSTALAFSAATSLSLSYPKWYVIAPASIYALGVGYSRIHLGAHYPSDVAAGAVLGAGSAIASRYLNKLITNQYRKRKLQKNPFDSK